MDLEEFTHPGRAAYTGLHPSLHDPEMSENTKDALLSMFGFYSANSEFQPKEGSEREGWGARFDSKNHYSKDDHAYRNSSKIGRADIIASGCSQTYGVGIPEDVRWSNQLGDLMGMSQVTVSLPGWSTQSMINGVMSYIKQYGKPKVVALLLPDFYRFDIAVNKTSMIFRLDEKNSSNLDLVRRINDVTEAYTRLPKISKKPHLIEEILPAEVSYFFSGQFLRFFIEYCKEAEIKLIWGTLSYPVHCLIEQVKSIEMQNKLFEPNVDFSDYVELDYFSGQGEINLTEKSCHQEKRVLYKEFFDYGVDKIKDNQPHMGVHMHTHVAEKFKEALDNLI